MPNKSDARDGLQPRVIRSVVCLQSGAFDKFGDLLRLQFAASLADSSELLSVFRLDLYADRFAWSVPGFAPRAWSFSSCCH